MKALKTGLKIIVGGTVLVGTFTLGAFAGMRAIGIAIADKYPAIGWFIQKSAKDDVAAITKDTSVWEAGKAGVIKFAFDDVID